MPCLFNDCLECCLCSIEHDCAASMQDNAGSIVAGSKGARACSHRSMQVHAQGSAAGTCVQAAHPTACHMIGCLHGDTVHVPFAPVHVSKPMHVNLRCEGIAMCSVVHV